MYIDTMKPIRLTLFEDNQEALNNCRFLLTYESEGDVIPKLIMRSSDGASQAYVISGKRPSPNDFRRAINKVIIQEIHAL